MTDISERDLAINQAANQILKDKINNLRVIPAVALKLLRLTYDKNTDVGNLSQLIETEPALAAKVLRNVNSAAFALPQKITSIKRAVNILGFSAVRQLALNQLFYNKLISHKARREFDQLFFWQHCLFVASLSRAIAMAVKHPDPDLIYSGGLMHDIGKIVFETHGKISYSDFILACKNDEQSSIKGEQDFFGLNHAEMGYVFCQQWALPEQISAMIFHHHDMPDENQTFSEYKKEIAIVSFADYIAWLHGIGSIASSNVPDIQPAISQQLNIEKLDIEDLLTHVDKEMQDTRAFYGIQFPSQNKLRATLVETTLFLNQSNQQNQFSNLPNKISINTLTTPHQSLVTDEIIPWTLAATHQDFEFDRLMMLNINPKQRSLISTYSWPEQSESGAVEPVNIKIDQLPDSILSCMRERKASIVKSDKVENKAILKHFDVEEFIILPVLSHNRLIAMLYADNHIKGSPIAANCIEQITPVMHELGVALANAKRFELEKKRAELDPFTGLMNKRMITDYLTEVFSSNNDTLQHIAVGFIDIDFFKNFNDTCGHQAGDNILKIVAQILRTLTRPKDFIGRYGGEEFVFVLQDTNAKGAQSYAERIRQEIERKGKILSQRFLGHELTVSIGISLYKPEYKTYNAIVEAADSAMYTAKNEGRNCVKIKK